VGAEDGQVGLVVEVGEPGVVGAGLGGVEGVGALVDP
jgi:hypothetical protein